MGLLEEVGEEISTLDMLNATKLDAMYCDLPSYQSEPIGDLATAEQTRAVPPPCHRRNKFHLNLNWLAR